MGELNTKIRKKYTKLRNEYANNRLTESGGEPYARVRDSSAFDAKAAKVLQSARSRRGEVHDGREATISCHKLRHKQMHSTLQTRILSTER
jgi:hypothetical protein